jgi:hypothetical protein
MSKSIAELLRTPFSGAEVNRGFNERAGVFAQAADGTDLNDYWDEVQRAIAIRNARRDYLINFLTFPVTDLVDEVILPGQSGDFEKMSEYGQPKGLRTSVNRRWRGYDFDFYDLAVRYTNMFLADADRRQLETITKSALEADNRLRYSLIMRRLFSPLNSTGFADNNLPVTVYAFYNGDGEVPPVYDTYTHTGTHNHYVTSQSLATTATLTPAVVDEMEAHLAHHGYEYNKGYRYVLLVNRQEETIVRQWKVAGGADWDFIPDPGGYGGGVILPAEQTRIVGQPQGSIPGQTGTYGPWHVVKMNEIPAGYMVGLVSGGPDGIGNPIGIREHRNAAYRGLKLIPGQRSDYPLNDSFYQRGIRHRGAGILTQVTGSATYTVPAAYA